MKFEFSGSVSPSQPSRFGPTLPALGIASLIAAGTNAYGVIVYSGPLNTVADNSTISFDLNSNMQNDFTLTSAGGEGGYIQFNPVGIYGAAGLIAGSSMAKISNGFTIDGSSSTWGVLGVSADVFSTYTLTNWGAMDASGPLTGYVGFRFAPMSGAGLNYGWMQLSVQANSLSTRPSVTVVDWAYENSGAAIQAGATSAIPEPSAVALIMGAASLLALRQRRRKAA